jgi:phosphoglycerate dehydrogenase-like enzyme
MPRRLTIAIFNEPERWSLDEAHVGWIADRAPEGVEIMAVANRESLLAALPETDYLVGFPLPISTDIEHFKRLRWVQLVGSGGESLAPSRALVARGVRITSASSIRAAATAEHAIALLLALTRGLPSAFVAQQEHRWATDEIAPTITELAGATVGIVDLDAIGAEIALRLAPFGVELLATADDSVEDDVRRSVRTTLPTNRTDELLSRSDAIIVANPSPAGRPLLTRADLAQLQPGSLLIDVSLSGVLRHADLVWALERRVLGAAGLDVFEQEPLAQESPLWSMPNVLITPHCSPVSPRYWDRACEIITTNLDRIVLEQPMIDEITHRWAGRGAVAH